MFSIFFEYIIIQIFNIFLYLNFKYYSGIFYVIYVINDKKQMIMTRELTLAKYIKAHEKQLTVESIIIIKEALKYYEEKFGELDDDYELEVQCAIEVYRSYLLERG